MDSSYIQHEFTTKNAKVKGTTDDHKNTKIRIHGSYNEDNQRYGLLQLIFQRKIEGKRSVARPKI